jgi:hypothetical protein
VNQKYYIVSEEELFRLEVAAYHEALDQSEGLKPNDELSNAKTVVRAQPIPEWATHLAGGNVHESYLPMSDRMEYCCDKIEEIKELGL